jgi:hypothetical protein
LAMGEKKKKKKKKGCLWLDQALGSMATQLS